VRATPSIPDSVDPLLPSLSQGSLSVHVGLLSVAVRCCLAMDGFRGTVDQLGHLLTEKIKKDQP
jgi:hypothetical protein